MHHIFYGCHITLFSDVIGHSCIRSLSNLLKIKPKGRYLQALSCCITFYRFWIITFYVQILYIGMINFTLKNQSWPVFSRQLDQLGLVLLGPVGSTQYMGQSRTGCSCGCLIWKLKNRTEPDLETLHLHGIHLPNYHHPLAKVIVMFQSPDFFELWASQCLWQWIQHIYIYI